MARVKAGAVLCMLLFVISACTDQKEVQMKKESTSTGMSIHGESAATQNSTTPFIDIVKKKTLREFPSVPLGKVFNDYSYFTQREWMETSNTKGKIFVDFIGWFDSKYLDDETVKRGVARRGLGFKFMLTMDGSFGLVMVSKLEEMTGRKMNSYPLEDAKGILGKLYGNKEIQF